MTRCADAQGRTGIDAHGYKITCVVCKQVFRPVNGQSAFDHYSQHLVKQALEEEPKHTRRSAQMPDLYLTLRAAVKSYIRAVGETEGVTFTDDIQIPHHRDIIQEIERELQAEYREARPI